MISVTRSSQAKDVRLPLPWVARPPNAVETGKTQSATGVTPLKDGVRRPLTIPVTGFCRHDGQGRLIHE
jgi:hypothetical protein